MENGKSNFNSDPKRFSIRAIGPRDVIEAFEKVAEKEGFTNSGMKPEPENNGTLRAYFIQSSDEYRRRHNLVAVLITATLQKPTPPSRSKDVLAKATQEVTPELEKAKAAVRAALNGTDAKALTDAKQHLASVQEIAGRIQNDEERWNVYDRDLEDYQQFKTTATELEHHRTTEYICASCGGPLTFVGPMNGTSGLSFISDAWMKSKVATYLIALDCNSCNSRVQMTPEGLRALEVEQRQHRPTKRRVAKQETWPA